MGGGGVEAVKSEFLQSHGAALTLRMAAGVLTRSTVGTCQVIGPYGFMFFSGADLLIIDSFRVIICKLLGSAC